MGEHMDLEVTAILEELLAAWATNNRRVPAVYLLRVPLEGRSRPQ